jgi:Na+/proline symporter
MIVAVVIVAILSLCCCGLSLPIFLGTGTYNGALGNSSTGGNIPQLYGLVCICAGLIPWIVLGIIVLIRRPKKQQ